MIRDLDIRMGPGPRDLAVQLEGANLTKALAGITIHQSGGEFPTVTLDLALMAVRVRGSADVRVMLPEVTRAALVALGWSPPLEEPTPATRNEYGTTYVIRGDQECCRYHAPTCADLSLAACCALCAERRGDTRD